MEIRINNFYILTIFTYTEPSKFKMSSVKYVKQSDTEGFFNRYTLFYKNGHITVNILIIEIFIFFR